MDTHTTMTTHRTRKVWRYFSAVIIILAIFVFTFLFAIQTKLMNRYKDGDINIKMSAKDLYRTVLSGTQRTSVLSQTSEATNVHFESTTATVTSTNLTNFENHIKVNTEKVIQTHAMTEGVKNISVSVSPTTVKGEQSGKKTECGEDKIYVSNEFYDCDGLLKENKDDAHDDKKRKKVKDDKKETMVSPTKLPKEKPGISSATEKSNPNRTLSNVDTYTSNNEKKLNQSKETQSKVFINCGGTFPWAVDLFLDTYPEAETFNIFSFVPDKSYSILYLKYANHTFIEAEAFYKNATVNIDVKSFGSAAEITHRFEMIDIGEWIKTHTKKSDFVILRLESEHYVEIYNHLVFNNITDLIDKYYSSAYQGDATKHLQTTMTSLLTTMPSHNRKIQFWDNHLNDYSNFDLLNPLQIPATGRSIVACNNDADDERFALLLYSSCASLVAFNVIDLLQKFSPNDRLNLMLFLPYETFKSKLINMNQLLKTFYVGMYYDENAAEIDERHEYLNIRNRATFVRTVFKHEGKVFEHILVGNNTNKESIEKIREKHHFSVFSGGVDGTHLIDKVLKGGTIYMRDTGMNAGDFLLVNIDTANAEYLILYMVKRFAPWLVNPADCGLHLTTLYN